jgi:dephospho-CoA kinase
MFCVALIGGIASGKSTAAKIFAEFGVEVISADIISREITTKNTNIIKKITNKFGSNILDAKQQIKRAMLREIIFNDKNARIWLENILHPMIREAIESTIKKSTSKICVIEIPLLKTKDAYPYLNHIVYIDTDQNIKLQRLTTRDNCSLEKALQILDSQPKSYEYAKIADTVIYNNGCLNELTKQIHAVLQKLMICTIDDRL